MRVSVVGSPDGDDDYPLDESPPRNDNDAEFEDAMTMHNRNQINLTGGLLTNW